MGKFSRKILQTQSQANTKRDLDPTGASKELSTPEQKKTNDFTHQDSKSKLSPSSALSGSYQEAKIAWLQSQGLDPEAKLFILTGNYPDVRKALLSAGWVENTNASSEFFDFKWTLRSKQQQYPELLPHQIVNHFQNPGSLTTKIGLLHNLQKLLWTHNVDVDTFSPRSYDMATDDLLNFVEEYKATKVQLRFFKLDVVGGIDSKAVRWGSKRH